MSTTGGRATHRNRWTALLTALFSVALTFALMLAGPEAASASSPFQEPGKVVFENGGRIISMKVDGTERTVLTRRNAWVGQPWGVQDIGPLVSPDGESILFNRYDDGFKDEVPTGLMVMDSDGGDLRQVYSTPKSSEVWGGDWSVDGSRIYFISYDEQSNDDKGTGTAKLMSMRPDGSDHQLILSSTFNYTENSVTGQKWLPISVVPAPDGRLLIETVNLFQDLPNRLEWADPGTGKRTILESDGGSASFSPNGATIVFASDRDGINRSCYEGRCSGDPQLFLKDIESGSVTRLIPGTPVDSSWSPSWSPDGNRIAFNSDRNNGEAEVWVISPEGTCLARLTNGSPSSSAPDWIPGGGSGTCDELTPEPLSEVTVGKWALNQKPRPLWLGPEHNGQMPDYTLLDGRSLTTGYGDCGRLDGNCGAQFMVLSGPVCSRELTSDLMQGDYLGMEKIRGGLLIRTDFQPGKNDNRPGRTLTSFISGGTETLLFTPGVMAGRKVGFGVHREAVMSLRFVNQTSLVEGDLAAPVLPYSLVKESRAFVKAFRSTGSLMGAAEKTGIFREPDFVGYPKGKRIARTWLRFGRDLNKLGPVRTVKCKRWSNRPGTNQTLSRFREMIK